MEEEKPIVICLYSDECCSFEKCPLFKKCWPEAYEDYLKNKEK